MSDFCPLWAGVWWWFWWVWFGVVGCVYSLALTRSRLTDSRKTAHGSRLAGVRLLAVGVRVGGGVRPSNLIFLALIIFGVWWGVFYSQTATEKRRTVCVRSSTLPQTFLRTPNTSHSVDGFGNLPNGGGEFRNRNHGVFL